MKDKNIDEIYSRLSDEGLEIDPSFKVQLKNDLFKGEVMAKQQGQLSIKQLFKQHAFMYAGSLAVLLIVATGVYGLNTSRENNQNQSIIESSLELPEDLGGILSIDSIRSLAGEDSTTGASITEIELENEHGVVLYKVKFSDGTYRLYDAYTGEDYSENHDFEVDADVPANFVAGISLQEARDIAEEEQPGKSVVKIELEVEEGVVVYSVRFADDSRVEVSAIDGSIVRIKLADNDQDSSGEEEDEDDSPDEDEEDDEDDEDDSPDEDEEDDEDDI